MTFQPPRKAEAETVQVKTTGRGAAEKRAIYERLVAFRQRNGLGCFAELEKASKGKVTEAELRTMLDAAPYPPGQMESGPGRAGPRRKERSLTIMDANRISFATISATGEKPAAEIHVAAFDLGKSLGVAQALQGTGGHLMQMIAHLVENYCAICKKETGVTGVKLFATLVGDALARGGGGKAVTLCGIEELRAFASSIKEEEEGGRDAEL